MSYALSPEHRPLRHNHDIYLHLIQDPSLKPLSQRGLSQPVYQKQHPLPLCSLISYTSWHYVSQVTIWK